MLHRLILAKSTNIITMYPGQTASLISKYTNIKDDQWPSMTTNWMVQVLADEKDFFNDDHSHSVCDWFRVGIQLIQMGSDTSEERMIEQRLFYQTMFQLNGQCGFVLKPKYLQNNRLYGVDSYTTVQNDKIGVWEYAVKLLGAVNVFERSPMTMNATVTFRVIGHPKDQNALLITKPCCSQGNKIRMHH